MSNNGQSSSVGREILPRGSGGLQGTPKYGSGRDGVQPGNPPNLVQAGSGGHQRGGRWPSIINTSSGEGVAVFIAKSTVFQSFRNSLGLIHEL
jgi:hypothetical protein